MLFQQNLSSKFKMNVSILLPVIYPSVVLLSSQQVLHKYGTQYGQCHLFIIVKLVVNNG